jgi:hypothetical protein
MVVEYHCGRCIGGVMRFLLLAVMLVAWAGSAAADTHGINVQVKDTAGTTVALYAESHALVVGISDYTNGWPRLRGVDEDVPAVMAALERQGFAVTVVMDPDRRQLDDAFRDFINRHGQQPDNRLLFYFAGHGHSMKLGHGGMMGYLNAQPVDVDIETREYKTAENRFLFLLDQLIHMPVTTRGDAAAKLRIILEKEEAFIEEADTDMVRCALDSILTFLEADEETEGRATSCPLVRCGATSVAGA